MRSDGLKLENARHEREQGYPTLRLDVEGRPVSLTTEWKPQLRAAGIVRVGEDLADLLPPINWTSEDGTATPLVGFTRDRRMVALFERFWEAANSGLYREGPVEIPG
jgi:hypothetical protein